MPVGRHTCVECKQKSPETELSYSLIGLAGWREVRVEGAGGVTRVEWRCPACWANYKQRTRARSQTRMPAIRDVQDVREVRRK
jgi:hypothetical protein